MTILSNADGATSEHPQPSLWERMALFLDVIGAVLIFGSWIFSHSLSQRAQDQAKANEAIIARVREFRLYDDFAYRISGMQSDLARTRNLVEHATRDGDPTDGGAESPPDHPTWTGMTATQIREMNDFVQALAGYAGELSASAAITRSIDTAQNGAKTLSRAFDTTRDEHDQLVADSKVPPSGIDDSAAAKAEELRVRVDRLWHDYDTAKQSMLGVGDDLLRTAAEESSAASQLARQCEYVSWVLYIFGTMIILFGRAKAVLSANKSGRD